MQRRKLPGQKCKRWLLKSQKNLRRKHKSRLQAAFVLCNYRLPIEKSERERKRERSTHSRDKCTIEERTVKISSISFRFSRLSLCTRSLVSRDCSHREKETERSRRRTRSGLTIAWSPPRYKLVIWKSRRSSHPVSLFSLASFSSSEFFEITWTHFLSVY